MIENHDKENWGCLYIATGGKYVRSALQSADSVLCHTTDIGTHLFTSINQLEVTTRERVLNTFDSVQDIKSPHARSKVDYIRRSPFDRTLYLDSDTRVVSGIRDVFAVLDQFDIALAHAHARYNPRTQAIWRHDIPEAFPQFNGGVIAYRDSANVNRLLCDWASAYHKADFTKDQVTLRELLWLSDLRIATLPPEYNVRYNKYLYIWRQQEATPKILHFNKFHDTFLTRLKRQLLNITIALLKQTGLYDLSKKLYHQIFNKR